jgi:hypothetical protein
LAGPVGGADAVLALVLELVQTLATLGLSRFADVERAAR